MIQSLTFSTMIKMIGMMIGKMTMVRTGKMVTWTWKIWKNGESIWKICGKKAGKKIRVKAGVEVMSSVDQEVKDADQDLKDQVDNLHSQTCAQIQRRFKTKISAGTQGFFSQIYHSMALTIILTNIISYLGPSRRGGAFLSFVHVLFVFLVLLVQSLKSQPLIDHLLGKQFSWFYNHDRTTR